MNPHQQHNLYACVVGACWRAVSPVTGMADSNGRRLCKCLSPTLLAVMDRANNTSSATLASGSVSPLLQGLTVFFRLPLVIEQIRNSFQQGIYSSTMGLDEEPRVGVEAHIDQGTKNFNPAVEDHADLGTTRSNQAVEVLQI